MNPHSTTNSHPQAEHASPSFLERLLQYILGQMDLKLLQGRYIISNVSAAIFTALAMSMPVIMFLYCLTISGAHYVGEQLNSLWKGFMVMTFTYALLFGLIYLLRRPIQRYFNTIFEKAIDNLIINRQLEEQQRKLTEPLNPTNAITSSPTTFSSTLSQSENHGQPQHN